MSGTRHDAARRVILVEDDDAYRYVLARELKAPGVEVLDVRLALDALDHLDRDPDIKLAVVDLRMPANTLTGLAFARMMRYRDRDARVVLMTAHPDYLVLPEAEPFGAVLLKTADTSTMAAGIHERLGLRADPSPTAAPAP
jgi:ActR/RegA family two-component response regulator